MGKNTINVLAFLIFLFMISLVSADLQSGPVLYLPFDDNTNDLSGNNNHAANNGAVFVDGVKGKAAEFDGFNNYVETPLKNWGLGYYLTVSFWLKTSDTVGVPVDIGWGHKRDEMLFYIGESGSGVISIDNHVVWTGNLLTTVNTQASLTPIDDNKWHHVVGIFDGSGQCGNLLIYIDGIREDGSCRGTAANINQNVQKIMRVGGRVSNDRNEYFAGAVDEVRVWNRVLTESEIKAEYESNKPSDLVLYFPFDGDVKDVSGNNNDGVNNGAVFVNGVKGKALRFDGNDFISAADSASLTFENFTFAAWLKIPNAAGTGGFLSQYNFPALNGYWSGYSGGSYYIEIGVGSGSWSPSISTPVTDTNWHHYVAVHNSTYTAIFIDGIEKINSTTASVMTHAATNFNFGRDNRLADNYFVGNADEIKIWSKALTEAEIKVEYDANNPDASVSLNELINYIQKWINGEISLNSLQQAIQKWINIA